MRDTWYADNRDLVKWGSVLWLTSAHDVKRVVQVAYLQPSRSPDLEVDGARQPMPASIWRHFRDLQNISHLAAAAKVQISIVDWPFTHRDRTGFNERLIKHLATIESPKVVLLDPDTGIAPRSHDARHVTAIEIGAVWASLRPRDWLLLYQHARRSGSWLADTRREFAEACGVGEATTFRSPAAASDVAIFGCQKSGA